MKFEGEDEMLRRYKVHMKMKEKFEDLQSRGKWKELLEEAEGEQELKVGRVG